ncbi:MAG: hypothetical protein WDZ82_01920 [Candidatus Paceibacterota bacterium]
MEFRIRVCRHGHSPHEGNDAARGLDDLGRQQIRDTAQNRFPKTVEPILVLTSRKERARETLEILLRETGNEKLIPEIIPLHGLDYSWPMANGGVTNFMYGPEHDNVLTVSQIMKNHPEFTSLIRGMLWGSLMTAIRMHRYSWKAYAPDEIWVASHSPFGEFLTPDPVSTTRRPNGGGFTFILDIPRDEEEGVVTGHSLELF